MAIHHAPRIVLRHKFVPPGRPVDVLQRPRVSNVIARLFSSRNVVTCVAPAGAGKTVQAQLYASSAGVPLAWLTLDRADCSVSRLLAGLATAVDDFATEGSEAVQAALRSGLSAQEAAAVLAETIRPNRFLFVIDECESIMVSDEALSVLGTFLEYAPPSSQALLLSREHFQGVIRRRGLDGTFGALFEEELRLTMEETESLIDVLGLAHMDASEVHATTGGWVAGLVFGFRRDDPASYDYLSADFASYLGQEVLGGLPVDEQRFLLDTSVLDVVTPEAAQALMGNEGRSLLERVRCRNLPATTASGEQVVYHSVLRSYLRSELVRSDPEREADLRHRFAEYLAASSHYEEATEVYLALGDLDAAAVTTERALKTMFRRADWSVLLRWLDLLGEPCVEQRPLLLAARIRALHGARRFEEAIELVERSDRLGQLRPATTSDLGLLATIGWLLQTNPAAALRYLDKYEGDFRVEAVRYMIDVTTGVTAVVPPPGNEWDDVQRLISWGLLWQGRLSELLRMVPDAEDSPVSNPNVLLALLWRGEVDTARGMWNRVPAAIRKRPQTLFIEGSILLAEGKPEAALAAAEEAISVNQHEGNSVGDTYEVFAAQVMVILGKVEDALCLLERRLPQLAATGHLAQLEWAQMVLGAAFLKAGRPEDAELVLEECVQSMSRARRRLYLPVAAVYLSEARARVGKDAAAFEAAELAYHTAAITGSLHMLVAALRTVPDVLERQKQRSSVDARWDRIELSRTPVRSSTLTVTADAVGLYVQPFGASRELFVNSVPTSVGRLKVLELAAFLALHPGGVDRFELQRQLFPDADQRRGGNHFRQIAHKLREATGVGLVRTSGNLMSWPDLVSIDSADLRFERLVADARASMGRPRLERLLEALDLVTGSYLQNSDLAWADERRYQLEIAREETLLETAALLLQDGQPQRARDHCEFVLDSNPYSEPAYRTLVQVERKIGTESSAMAVYRRAVDALNELGLRPDARMRKLLRAPLTTRNG